MKQEELEDKIRREYHEILPQLKKIESLLISTVRWQLKSEDFEKKFSEFVKNQKSRK